MLLGFREPIRAKRTDTNDKSAFEKKKHYLFKNRDQAKTSEQQKKELDNPRLKSKMYYKCHNVALVLLYINNSNVGTSYE